MLSAKVAPIPAMVVSDVNGLQAPLLFNCYQAVCYWIYHEMNGAPPMGWAFADSKLQNTGELMRALARNGRLATQSNINTLPNGTVLIFTDPDGTERHACIIDATGQLGGYNQQSWFDLPPAGQPNQFTQHPINKIKWRNGKNNKVFLSSGAKGKLHYIDEATALNFARFSF
jgi:hypothetical protein